MNRILFFGTAALFFLFFPLLSGGIKMEKGQIRLTVKTGSVLLDAASGTIRRIGSTSIQGPLWELTFDGGKRLASTDFSRKGNSLAWREENGKLRLHCRSPQADVDVTISLNEESFDFQAWVVPKGKQVVREFSLPGRLRFLADDVRRVVSFIDAHRSIGTAYNANFFRRFDREILYQMEAQGEAPYRIVYGGDAVKTTGTVSRLRITADGEQWFSRETREQLEKMSGPVSRPFGPGQVDLELVRNGSDVLLGASRLGGKGWLFRMAAWPQTLWGKGASSDRDLARAYGDLFRAVVRQAPKERRKAGFIDIAGLPARGNGGLPTALLKEQFLNIPSGSAIEKVMLTTPNAVLKAVQDPAFLMIVNPNGELSPLRREEIPLLRDFVRSGGVWFETGGYSFYYWPRRILYAVNEATVPGKAFADFNFFSFKNTDFAMFQIHRQDYEPWSAGKNGENTVLELAAKLGSDDRGGFLERSWQLFLTPGTKWSSPVTRILFDGDVYSAADSFCKANGQAMRIEEKASPKLITALKQSVLLKFMGNLQESFAVLDKLPVPVLIHNSDYLKGGFDKQYPDHLPPAPAYGTPEEFKRFLAELRKRGILYMPYTNPSWWCDEPRGETFLRAGDAPLARGRNGKPIREQYLRNGGFTTTLWHPEVRKANRETVRLFKEEYPADLLFQDQCGARRARVDFNPASPAPYAYAEGIASMLREDSRWIPLATEEGSFHLMNSELMFCGFERNTIPPGRGELLRHTRPDGTWNYFPLYQIMAHDKAVLTLHDLWRGADRDEKLAWIFGWGFMINYSIHARDFKDPARVEWLKWLAALQKHVASRIFGTPVREFEHRWGKTSGMYDNGSIRAVYGDMRVTANLSPSKLSVTGKEIPPYGIHVEGPGVLAASLPGRTVNANAGFILEAQKEGFDLYVYSIPGSSINVPYTHSGKISLRDGSGKEIPFALKNGRLNFRAPGSAKVRCRVLRKLKIKEAGE